MIKEVKTDKLLDLTQTIAVDLFNRHDYPWEVLGEIKDEILKIGPSLPNDQYNLIGEDVWVHKSVRVADSAFINGPAIIGKDTEIRHCAFIRGSVIVGDGVVVGNSTELKNVVLFNSVQVPHYNYVGDSVLGYKAHMGAGAITSNVKSDRSLVQLKLESQLIETGHKKFGAIIGDFVEIGCNSVLNPGSIIGREASIYPLSMVRGYVSENSIYKKAGEIVTKK